MLHSSPLDSTVASHELDSTQAAVARSVVALGVLGFLFSLAVIFIGFHHTVYDFHPFRQSQTALNVVSIARGDGFLHYQDPIFGAPWTVPWEFPLYQGIVAEIVRHMGTPVEETGRAVSILFFYLCFFPLASILRDLRFRKLQIIAVLTVFAMSPLYIFVSRMFMIESTALFFSLLYVQQMSRLALVGNGWKFRYAIGAAIFGCLAGLVKVTTLAPYFLLGMGFVAWRAWKLYRSGELRWVKVGAVVFLDSLLPVVVTECWIKYSDSLKSDNPLSALLLSGEMTQWNYGTISQRLQPRFYSLLGSRVPFQIGYVYAALIIVGVFAGMLIAGGYAKHFERWSKIALVGLLIYAGTTMLFFNLHAVHEYYPYASTVGILVAIGALLAAFLGLPGSKAWVGVVLLALEMSACVFCYFRHYYPMQSVNAPGFSTVSAILDRTTSDDSVVVITGLNWSPQLSYQSHRRSIMDASFAIPKNPAELGPIQQVILRQGPQSIAAVVACDKSRNSDRLQAILHLVRMSSNTEMHGDECDIYERAAGH